VRTGLPPLAARSQRPRTGYAIDKDQPVTERRTLETLIDSDLLGAALQLVMSAIFGLLGCCWRRLASTA